MGQREKTVSELGYRTKQIYGLIEPGSSVIEFGAGRLVLKAFLPKGCDYTPTDLVDRGEGTIVCDLNGTSLPEPRPYDVAVFSGVLEYVVDVPRLISHLSKSVEVIIASYVVAQSNRVSRRAHGWVIDYTSAQFVEVFENARFCCDHSEEWTSQVIYKFRKSEDQSLSPPLAQDRHHG